MLGEISGLMDDPAPSPVEALRSTLRADLKDAMRARRAVDVSVLRSLIGALDNAEAVPVAPGPYVSRTFGDGSAEVPRLVLSAEDVRRVVEEEALSRWAAAGDLEGHGQHERAAALRDEALIVQRYISDPNSI